MAPVPRAPPPAAALHGASASSGKEDSERKSGLVCPMGPEAMVTYVYPSVICITGQIESKPGLTGCDTETGVVVVGNGEYQRLHS